MNPSRSGAPARGTGIASEKMLKSRTGAPKEGEMRERRTTVGAFMRALPLFSLYAAAPLGGRGFTSTFGRGLWGTNPSGAARPSPETLGFWKTLGDDMA